ncbi:COG1361 S-layer family protein [Vallitalea guaymasensis]|uniref:COG1361 S-layer family protein n=1 Tax=Vallitalea guaymasensis TaxID=1185412 RepID=UPI002353DB5B|nr:CARDB domain-containing protein [Vallitalea guaymasensis]
MKKTKLLIYLCALIMVFNVAGIKVAATTETNDIIVDSYSVSKSTIYEGTEFTLTVNLKKIGSGTITGTPTLGINPGSFILKDKGSVISINPANLNAGGKETITLPLKCSGTNNVIELIFNYVDGGDSKSSVNKITIDMVKASNNSNENTTTNTKKYNPELQVTNQDIPTARAGSVLNLSLELQNISSHTAKDITVEFIPSKEDGFLYETNKMSMVHKIKQLKAKEKTNLEYSLTILNDSKAKTYTGQLKYTYYNLYGDLKEKTQDIYIKVKKGFPDVNLEIDKIETLPKIIYSGSEAQLSFLVNNNAGLSSVKDIEVSLQGLSGEGFTIANGVNSNKISILPPDSPGKKVTFNLYAADKMTKGSYPIKVKLKYQDNLNNEQIVEKEIYLKVEQKKSNIAIENIKAPSGTITGTNKFKVSFDLVNTSDIDTKDLTVTVKPDEGIVPVSQSVQVLKLLKTGTTKKLEFEFQPTAEAKTKNHLINIEVKGSNEEALTTINQYVGVYVKENDKATNSKPNIIIDSYATEPTIVKAGENFKLNISFNNTHKNKKVQNVKVYLTAEENTSNSNNNNSNDKSGSVFTPVNSSNTFFIDEISPKQSVNKQLTLYTIPYAAAKTHTIKVNLEYEDDKANQYKATELVSVPVIQSSSFITSDINIPEAMSVNQPHTVSLEISNTGKTTLDNFTVAIEGFGSKNSKGYLGNLQSGKTTYHDIELWPTQEGEVKGNLIFSYTKPDGKTEEVKKEIHTMATADIMPEEGEFVDENGEMINIENEINAPKSKMSITMIAGIIGVGLIILIVIIRVIKKKKDMIDDE